MHILKAESRRYARGRWGTATCSSSSAKDQVLARPIHFRWGCPSLTTGNSVLTRELTRHTRAFRNSPSCISTINCFDQHSTKYYMQGVSMQGSGNGHVMGWSWVKVMEGCSICLKSSSVSIAQGVEVGRELLRRWNLMQVPQTKIESKNICIRDLKNIKYTYQRLDWHKKLQWSKLKDWFFCKNSKRNQL